jgi:hypothetical protein
MLLQCFTSVQEYIEKQDIKMRMNNTDLWDTSYMQEITCVCIIVINLYFTGYLMICIVSIIFGRSCGGAK